MPPSGFETTEVHSLASTATSLLTRFQSEVETGDHLSVEEGIVNELAIIDRELARDIGHVERGVLMFVRELYLGLQAGATLEEIEREIKVLATKTYT